MYLFPDLSSQHIEDGYNRGGTRAALCGTSTLTFERWCQMRRAGIIIAFLFVIFSFSGETRAAAASPFAHLKFRGIGPAVSGGRVPAVAGTDADPFLYYAGSSGGGVWRTTDGGITWDPVFAHKPVSAIGALAIAASNKKIVWVGTGEANPRNDDMTGDGVWLSTDGGATFKHRGLDGTAMISRILVDPKNPNIVLAAALGNAYIDDENRGVYRTTDAGKTWTKTLYIGPGSGASDMDWSPKTRAWYSPASGNSAATRGT